MGGMGDGIFADRDPGFIEGDLRSRTMRHMDIVDWHGTRRQELESEAAGIALSNTVEIEGEHNG